MGYTSGKKGKEDKGFGGKKKSLKGSYKGKWQFQEVLKKRKAGQARLAHEGANAVPKEDDESVVRVPSLTTAHFLPTVESDAPQPLDWGKTNSQLRKEKRQEKTQKRKEATARAVEKGDKAASNTAAEQEKADEPAKIDLPKQRPGESKYAYFARLDKATVERLRMTSRKVPSEPMRAKKRKKRQDKKEEKTKKKEDFRVDDSDGLFVAGQRADFGDTAERPPQLSNAALKSRSKLKRGGKVVVFPEKSGASSHAKDATGAARDLADYAAKVRAAYANMKKQRLEAHR